MASFVIGPLATFSRPLIDEELPTLYAFTNAEWTIDMDVSPQRGTVELTRIATLPRKVLSAPKLAAQHDRYMRRQRG